MKRTIKTTTHGDHAYVYKKVSTQLHTGGTGIWTIEKRPVDITGLEVNYFTHENPLCGELRVFFKNTWMVRKYGLIYTDRQFLAELKRYLKSIGLPTNIDYSEQGMQGSNFVSLDVDKKFIYAFESNKVKPAKIAEPYKLVNLGVNLPAHLAVGDHHEIAPLQSHLRRIIPNLKVKKVSVFNCTHHCVAYVGDQRDPATLAVIRKIKQDAKAAEERRNHRT